MRTCGRSLPALALVLASLTACADIPLNGDRTSSFAPTGKPASASGGTREWSGESGASGHPTMTSDAIRAAASDFPSCLARYSHDAARRGSTAICHVNTLQRATKIMTSPVGGMLVKY